MTRERELERERDSYYVLGACCYVCVEVERLQLRACGNTQGGPTLETKRAVVMEPAEKRLHVLMQKVIACLYTCMYCTCMYIHKAQCLHVHMRKAMLECTGRIVPMIMHDGLHASKKPVFLR